MGPANTLYLPGPLLKACNNELVLLELGNKMKADSSAKGAPSLNSLSPETIINNVVLFASNSQVSAV